MVLVLVLVDGDVGFVSSVERLGLLVWYIYEYNNWKAYREIIDIMRYYMMILYIYQNQASAQIFRETHRDSASTHPVGRKP